MAGRIKGITIEIGGDTTGLDKALSSVEKNANKVQKELKDVDRALKFDPGNTELLAQKQDLLAKNIGNVKEKLTTLRNAQEQVNRQFENGNIGEEQYRAFKREIEVTKNVLDGYENKLENVTNTLHGNASAVDSSSKSMKGLQAETNSLLRADMLSEFADNIGQAAEKVLDFSKKTIEAWQEVDDAMDGVTTKTGASGDKLKELQDTASNIATTMPTDFETAGNAVGVLHQQFGLTGKALDESSRQLIKFSSITGTDVTTAGTTARQAIDAFGLSSKDLGTVLDSVAKVSQTTGVSVDTLMQKAIDGAPQIKSLGLSFEEGVSLMGKFEQSGLDSSAMLGSLAKASVKYAKEGKSLTDGLNDTVDAIKNSKNEQEALNIAAEIFGAKKAPQMVDAIKRGAFSFKDLANSSKNSAGTVSKTFKETLDPIDKFKAKSNEAKKALGEIGGEILNTLVPAFDPLIDTLSQVVKWFTNLSEPIKQFIVVFGVIATVVGLLLPVFFALQAAAIFLETTIGAMILSFAPIAGVILGIIAVIAILIIAFKELWTKNEGFRTAVIEIWNNISNFIGNIISQIAEFIVSIWSSLVDWWDSNHELILSTASKVWNAILNVIKVVMEIIGPYLEAMWNNIKTVVSGVWEIIKVVVMTAINVILGIVKAAMQIINGDWSGAWETIKSVVSSVWESIKSIISTAVNTISQVVSNTWNALVVTIQFILNMIYNIIMSVWNSIVSFISGVINSITQTVSNGFNTVHNTISNIMNGILGTVQNVWNNVKSTISNAINSAKDAVSTAINAIKNLMNFSWSLPRPKIPKFNISGGEAPWGFGGKGSLPSISVSWFAKGGILTKPTAFGLNGNSVMVGGEAGQEAVLPLNKDTLGMIGDRIMSTFTDRIVIQQPQQEATIILNIDGKTFAKLIVPFISSEQAQRLQIIETGGTIL